MSTFTPRRGDGVFNVMGMVRLRRSDRRPCERLPVGSSLPVVIFAKNDLIVFWLSHQ